MTKCKTMSTMIQDISMIVRHRLQSLTIITYYIIIVQEPLEMKMQYVQTQWVIMTSIVMTELKPITLHLKQWVSQ